MSTEEFDLMYKGSEFQSLGTQTEKDLYPYVLTPGEVLPYMEYIGMCRCEGYSFQAVYSRIEYINHSVWV